LFDRLQHCCSLQKVVYAAAGCAVAEKTFDDAAATPEDAPVSLFHDSPYSISKLIGEMYGNYYFTRHGLPFVRARFQNVYGTGARLGPLRPPFRRPEEVARAARLHRRNGIARRPPANDRLDPRQPRHDPPLHVATRPLPAGPPRRPRRMNRVRLLTVVGARP